MFAAKASNALFAVIRAKYGKRLTLEDYREMAALRTVGEVSAFLRQRTAYAGALQSVKHNDIHRAALEQLLRNDYWKETAKLCRFEKSIGQHLFEHILLRHEAEQLLLYSRCLAGGRPEAFARLRTYALDRFAALDVKRLESIDSVKDFQSFLRDTKNHKIISALYVGKNQGVDVTLIESLLDRQVYQHSEAMICTYFHGGEKDGLLQLLQMRAELTDIQMIWRAKRYYRLNSDLIRSQVIGIRRLLSAREYDRLIEAPSPAALIADLRKTRYGRYLPAGELFALEQTMETILLRFYAHNIHFSTSPAIVMLTYINLSAIQLENVITVVEGIRYRLPPEQIIKLLRIRKEGALSDVC